jgi:mono/diheme cytochrome c family protein
VRIAVAAALAAAGGAVAAADGAALYAQHCAPCHQPDAGGAVGLAPPLKGEHWVKLGAERGYLPMVLVHGLAGKIQLGNQIFVGNMPSFGAQLDDATIAAIATHVRTLQGAAAERPIGADEVLAARKAGGSPPQSRQRREQILGG